jgi:DnaJ family protein C protein 2
MSVLPPLSGETASLFARAARPVPKTVETAGWSFATEAWAQANREEATAAAADAADQGETKTGEVAKQVKESPTTAKKTLLASALSGGAVDTDNYYGLLGLEAEGADATQKQIKVAYHRKLLELHPDKNDAVEDENDPIFLAVQKAYNTLNNETKRRGYDSQFDFDDSIPDKQFKGDFYKVFGPVFKRNERFSTKKPLPKLGDEAMTDDDVRSFYEVWHRFESWRDFSSLDEHNVEEAEDREEKRWLMQQNKAARAKAKKKENKRVQELVTRAKNLDPRVARANKNEQEARQRVIDEKAAAKKAAEEEKKAADEAEKKAADEAAAASKNAKDANKAAKHKKGKDLRKARKALKAVLKPDWLNPVELLELVGALDTPKCLALVEAIAAAGGDDAAKAAVVAAKEAEGV